MKYLLLIVLLVVVWLIFFKARPRPPQPPRERRGARGAAPTMLECAHCGIHFPQPEGVVDATGRSYCGEAHRLAGPR